MCVSVQPVTSKQDINQKVIGIEEQKLKGVIETAEKPSEYSKKEAAPPPNKGMILLRKMLVDAFFFFFLYSFLPLSLLRICQGTLGKH